MIPVALIHHWLLLHWPSVAGPGVGVLGLSIAIVALSSINGRTETRTCAKIVRSGAGMQAVTGIQMPQLSNASFNFQLALDKEVQRSTFITEIAQGLTDAKGETTATEVNVTSQYASVLIGDISQHIEDTFLSPIAGG